jgi:hypothetical protein
MNMRGETTGNFTPRADAYASANAGIADSADHITGTWVDMRGSMDPNTDLKQTNAPDQVKITADQSRKIIFPIHSGWYTMLKKDCPKDYPKDQQPKSCPKDWPNKWPI